MDHGSLEIRSGAATYRSNKSAEKLPACCAKAGGTGHHCHVKGPGQTSKETCNAANSFHFAAKQEYKEHGCLRDRGLVVRLADVFADAEKVVWSPIVGADMPLFKSWAR